jgi:tetratricopeptide (TPR) repeat protein
VQQPFARAICIGAKGVENRTWGTDYRGIVAIHAGMKKQRVNELAKQVGKNKISAGLFTYGAVIGVAELVDVVDLNESLESDPFAFGPVCWLFRNAVILPSPVPSKGKLNLYTLTERESEQVRKQLAGLRPGPVPPAEQVWLAAMKLEPAEAALSRTMSYATLEKYDDALRTCEVTLRLDPCCGDAYRLRGAIKIAKGDDRGGISDCDEAIRLDPKDARAYLVRSDGYLGLEDQARADADYQEAVRLDPSLADDVGDEGEEEPESEE